jgi:protein-S-isoprenylcysteine O-methyltransferase Ste14
MAPYKSARLALAGVAMNATFFALVLFVPAWTLDWWRAWVIIAIVIVGTAGSTIDLARVDSGLLEERFKSPVQRAQPLGDKILLIALLLSFFGYLSFTSLDATHLHLLPRPPDWLSLAGLAATVGGWAIAWRALRENAFAAPVVKLQEDRRQHVVDTGLYCFVRHPLYAGGALLIVGLPLWLQSTAGILASLVPVAVLMIRIILEERFLCRELPGYDDYATRVRYRLIPLIW